MACKGIDSSVTPNKRGAGTELSSWPQLCSVSSAHFSKHSTGKGLISHWRTLAGRTCPLAEGILVEDEFPQASCSQHPALAYSHRACCICCPSSMTSWRASKCRAPTMCQAFLHRNSINDLLYSSSLSQE
jgi:hypothetical protein